MKQYYQARLQQGTKETIGWIEQRGAAVGRYVMVDDDWWFVAEVWKHSLTEEQLKKNQLLHRNSLPSIRGNK